MSMRSNMPHELWPFYQKDGYFFMDHGDVYYGCFVEFQKFPESIFIVQPSHRKEILEINNKDATLEKITSLAWEIKDFNKIKFFADGGKDIGNSNYTPNSATHDTRDWKKMFVFGAGASAFSVFKDDINNFRNFAYSPPIANELFGKKFESHIKKYKGVELSLSSLRAFGNDVEAFFENEWESIINVHNPAVASRHINIAFYLKEIFDKISQETITNFYDCSLYSLFTDKMQKYLSKNRNEKVAIVSFNYDTILDHYLAHFFNTPFNSLQDYVDINKKPFFLFKPHGSCNWGWKFPKNFIETNSTDIPKFLYEKQSSFSELYFQQLGTPYEMIYQKSWGHELALSNHRNGKFTINKNNIEVIHRNDEQYFPSLLIPYKDKDEMVMPYYHYSLMQWFVGELEDLYLIGWKGNEVAFNNLISKHAHKLKRIFIINPNPREVESYLIEHLDLKKYELIYFDNFESFATSNIS